MSEIQKSAYPDVLADRYASPEMVNIWAPEGKVLLQRQLWIAVLELQAELGVDVDPDVIESYRQAAPNIDLDSIRNREMKSKHDVVANIEEFNALAGHQRIHTGMTSRDSTENIEQMQVLRSLEITRDKSVASLAHAADLAMQYADQAMVGRSHNVPAQMITLGKRFANFGTEMLHGHQSLQHVIDAYPLRGIKGPVGTQQDMLDIFGGDEEKVMELESRIAQQLGFSATLGSVGQVYPRSLDGEVIDSLFRLSSGPANMANTIRLMAGHDLVTEGFQKGQTGSSAMPHKMNTKNSERIVSLNHVLAGFQTMGARLNGDQWNEGDVSCSALRRVALPGSFLAIDGLQETHMNVMSQFGAFPNIIGNEIDRHMPFLTTTKILMALTKAGMGREVGHEIIKEHAVAYATTMREGNEGDSFYKRLGDDDRIPLTEVELQNAVQDPLELTGLAGRQVEEFAKAVGELADAHPTAASYTPAKIL